LKIIDGKKIADSIRHFLTSEIQKHPHQAPGLAFILIGDDPASKTYVKMKASACKEVGIHSHVIHLPHDVPQNLLLLEIERLNAHDAIDGILVQQPLPRHLDPLKVLQAVNPDKDVDGFHPVNIGKLLLQDSSGFVPCTPLGILRLLEAYAIPTQGRHVVIVGRSLIVGKPLANLLSEKSPRGNATVTLCHGQTPDLASYTKQADILIVAVGRQELITADHVKPGAVVIDVGINRVHHQGKTQLLGDVHFPSVAEQASMITPVPGGVGPMTIALLLENTYKAFSKKHFSK
jgi:methylenetetrahydrofolate dehydrogenase (NADP+)/methenyltetrahydrofolate cyclohydrolase